MLFVANSFCGQVGISTRDTCSINKYVVDTQLIVWHLYCALSRILRSTARRAKSGASFIAASTSFWLRPRDSAMPWSLQGNRVCSC